MGGIIGMKTILDYSLFETQPLQFEYLNDLTQQFSAVYCADSMVRDNIFAVIENYARKKEIHLEILKYPVHDKDLWAMTFLKKQTVFVWVNTELPLCKQFFAAAHELYHIYCYTENADQSYLKNGSILSSDIADEKGNIQEDLEANAFAGLLMMSDLALLNQMKVFGIDSCKLDVSSVLMLMDLFALPYKATILRLYECHCLNKNEAVNLLSITKEDIRLKMELTNKAKRWQLDGTGNESFGSLLEKMNFNITHDYLTESRKKEDKTFIENLEKELGMK